MKKRTYIIIILLITAIILIPRIYQAYIKQKETDTAYNYAVTLLRNNAYNAALAELEKASPQITEMEDFEKKIKDYNAENAYKNTVFLYAYALAHINYDDGGEMSDTNEYLELIPDDYSGELSKEISIFKTKFKTEYDEYLAEKARKAEEIRKKAAKKDIPQKNMNETPVSDTSSPSEKETVNDSGNTLKIHSDNIHSATKYSSSNSSGSVSRNNGNNNSSSRKTKVYNGDDYDVKDYYDAEDFYDDHYDDFYDYEEAEDYYNEHGMW